jgi:hypothetical protein
MHGGFLRHSSIVEGNGGIGTIVDDSGKSDLDGGIPIPGVIAIGFALVPIAVMVAGVMVQRYRTKERLSAIEKGVPLPSRSSRPALSPWEAAANFRVAGIVCVAIGLGLLILFTSLAATVVSATKPFPKGIIAISAIPLLLGFGFLIEYRMRRKEIGARAQEPVLR